jgi:hypothetical protein
MVAKFGGFGEQKQVKAVVATPLFPSKFAQNGL